MTRELSQECLGGLAGVDRGYVSLVERDKVNRTVTTLVRSPVPSGGISADCSTASPDTASRTLVFMAPQDRLPELKLIAGLVPHWGPTLAAYVQDRHDRESRRLEALAEGVRDHGVEPEAILAAATTHPEFGALVDAAFGAAQRSSWPDKARMLGRALADGHLARDDAKLDEVGLLLSTIAALEAVDVRVLDLLQRIMTDRMPVPETESSGDGLGKGISVMNLSKYTGGISQPALTHIVSRLSGLGLITTLGRSYQGMSSGWVPSDYGVAVLQYLLAAGTDEEGAG